ncbi:poly [ADP-ribose] polymerase tankyrase-1-like [Patiria miniata]|uniref:SOCS box domain-containing protein n=1 Tax=Patiria miniata TaxID=46514 RepID=A0A913ZZL7_PATMI|nr:poly [ADP-ribose] polymerase tankyrase-1-like [Patiria miniata]
MFFTPTVELWWVKSSDLVDLINSDCTSARFRRLLRHCLNPNKTVGDMQLTPLHHAVYKQRSDCVDHLLNQLADVNVQDCCGYTPVHLAAKHGLVDILEQLVRPVNRADTNKPDVVGMTPLSLAIQGGHRACAEVLLKNGANPNYSHKHIGYEIHRVPFDSPECFQLLLRYGANPESRTPTRGLTALHAAVEAGNLEFVEIVVTLGCNIHAWTTPRAPERPRRNALQLAIIGNEVDIVRCLLAHGADPNCRDQQGNTPLHHASAHRDTDIITVLLDNGADIHALNDRQYQPLHRACSAGRGPEILSLLMRSGADMDARTRTNDTPLKCLLLHYINVLLTEEEDHSQVDHACLLGIVAFINSGGRFTISTDRDDFRSLLKLLPQLTSLPQTIQLLIAGSDCIYIEDIDDLLFSFIREPLRTQLYLATRNPPCLGRMVRRAIRCLIGYKRCEEAVRDLPLPVLLQDYLLFYWG